MARGRKPSTKQEKSWRRGNGKGSVYKLSGNRRNPWVAAAPAQIIFDAEILKASMKRKIIGYYPDKDSAEYALSQYLHGDLIEKPDYTFTNIFELWYADYYKDKSIDASKASRTAFNYSRNLHDRPFVDITIKDLEDTILNCQEGYSIKSKMKTLYNLMYDYAVKAEIVNINKARNFSVSKQISKQKRIEKKDKIPLSPEHIKKLFNAYDYGYNRMILIAIYSGLRPQELCLVERANVFLDDDYIIAGMKTEAGTDRIVPIHPLIKPYIEYYYNQSEGHPYLFLCTDGKSRGLMTYQKYLSRFKISMSLIGANDLYTPHCTRHTFISLAKTYNIDDFALKRIVGHSINDVTEAVYTHRDKDFLYNEICKIK